MQKNQARDMIIEISEHLSFQSLNKSDKDFIAGKVGGARFAKMHDVEFELRDEQAQKVLRILESLN